MDKNRINWIFLTTIVFIVFLFLCSFPDVVQVFGHFNSEERIGRCLGTIGLLAMFGFLFYGIGYMKGIEVGREIQQNPKKFDELKSKKIGEYN